MTVYDEYQAWVRGEQFADLLQSRAQTVVCPTNTVGTMGKGLAKQFAEAYPGLLHAYRQACKDGEHTIEKPWVYKVNSRKQILCVATKKHWKNDSKEEWVEAGLRAIRDHWKDYDIRSLAVPMLGCGNGGLDWQRVYYLLYVYLDEPRIPVYIYN